MEFFSKRIWLVSAGVVHGCRLKNSALRRHEITTRHRANKVVSVVVLGVSGCFDHQRHFMMICCSCYILGAHGGPRLRLHRFPEGRRWQAGCNMKTRPAGIGNINADWMGCLPSKLSAMPLKHLAVPGEPVVRKGVWPPLTITLGLISKKTVTLVRLSLVQALMILLPTGWMCTLPWDPIRSHMWSTWPQCLMSLPRK